MKLIFKVLLLGAIALPVGTSAIIYSVNKENENMKINWKQIWQQTWPHVVAILAFVLLCVVYFAPEFFDNKQLPQGDVISAVGMGQDGRNYHEQSGEYAHWSNAMFGGMPHNMTFTQGSKSIFSHVERFFQLWLPRYTAAPLFLYLLGFYIFMLSVGCSPWLSIVGSIAFAFASYNIIIITPIL